ncbi:MAG: metallophosphoesterase, partial [Fimbriimonadales bacterium]
MLGESGVVMRFLHTSDVHLGRAFGYLGERASEHQERLRRAFQRLFHLASEQSCKAVLIAGDLFDSPQVSQ